jgi:hypothetical protein
LRIFLPAEIKWLKKPPCPSASIPHPFRRAIVIELISQRRPPFCSTSLLTLARAQCIYVIGSSLIGGRFSLNNCITLRAAIFTQGSGSFRRNIPYRCPAIGGRSAIAPLVRAGTNNPTKPKPKPKPGTNAGAAEKETAART